MYPRFPCCQLEQFDLEKLSTLRNNNTPEGSSMKGCRPGHSARGWGTWHPEAPKCPLSMRSWYKQDSCCRTPYHGPNEPTSAMDYSIRPHSWLSSANSTTKLGGFWFRVGVSLSRRTAVLLVSPSRSTYINALDGDQSSISLSTSYLNLTS